VEDMDLAVRAMLQGWKFLYVGDIKVRQCSVYRLPCRKLRNITGDESNDPQGNCICVCVLI
jgi:hypothetical protein